MSSPANSTRLSMSVWRREEPAKVEKQKKEIDTKISHINSVKKVIGNFVSIADERHNDDFDMLGRAIFIDGTPTAIDFAHMKAKKYE